MAKKSRIHSNAGPIFSVLRLLTGLILGACLWFLIGWATSSITLGVLLASWVLILGPVVFPVVVRFFLKGPGSSRLRFNWENDKPLASEFFRSLIQNPGPEPEIWVRPGIDHGFLLVRKPGIKRDRFWLLVSSAWTQDSVRARIEDWRRIWEVMRKSSTWAHKLQFYQMAAWFAVLFPLEIWVQFCQSVVDILGFKELPRISFWTLPFLLKVKRFWFGTLDEDAENPDQRSLIHTALKNQDRRLDRSIRPGFHVAWGWNSLTLGVWVKGSVREAHPLWPAWLGSQGLL